MKLPKPNTILTNKPTTNITNPNTNYACASTTNRAEATNLINLNYGAADIAGYIVSHDFSGIV